MTDLLKKLRLKEEALLLLVNAPDDCKYLFESLEVQTKPTVKNKPAAQLLLFVYSAAELGHYLQKLDEYIGNNTVFWICYPKKSGRISSDLILMKSWNVATEAGYRGQTSASVNDDWSGLRMTKAPRAKPSICDLPMEERQSEGIDYVKRTVSLPADAFGALQKFAGMASFFDMLSFTVKKEYVLSITESKKPETRVRRIEKMIMELQQKMAIKAGGKTKKAL